MNKSILLFGGASEERLVSVASSQNLATQFEFEKLWFVDPHGAVYEVEPPELAAHERPFEVQFQARRPAFAGSLAEAIRFVGDRAIFIGMHGAEGEDGTIQGLFEANRIAFTGSGAAASKACFDKAKAKAMLKGHGVLLADQLEVKRGVNSDLKTLEAFFDRFGKIVIKPVASGSSFGLQIVSERAELKGAAEAISKSEFADFLVEQFVTGRELTVGVLEAEAGVVALPPSEVVLNAGHSFDYQGKYLGRGTTEITPADLNDRQRADARALAIKAHQLLGCYGYSRTDMILTAEGPYFLETNTLPGMSKASFIPQQLRADERPFTGFIEKQLELARRRYSR